MISSRTNIANINVFLFSWDTRGGVVVVVVVVAAAAAAAVVVATNKILRVRTYCCFVDYRI